MYVLGDVCIKSHGIMYQPYKHRAFLAGVAPGGVVFSTPLHNSLVFKVKLLKVCTELLWDKMNILRQRESGSN